MCLYRKSTSLEQYHQQQRVDFLLQLYKEGTLNDDQHQELIDLLARPENQDRASLWLDEVWKQTPDQHFFSASKSNQLHQSVLSKIDPAEPKVWRLNKTIISIVAAAAVIAIVFSFLFLRQSNFAHTDTSLVSKKDTSAFIADLGPGGNKATLKLANNRVIVLDQVKNGLVLNAGNLLVKKSVEGQLIFQVNQASKNDAALSGQNILTTPAGGQYQVLLADGSKVWLNASSSLKFPSSFTGNERKVELTGEGYFEISKSKNQPFIVNAREMKVEVLGTHFNINAYPDEQLLATTLIEGSVKLTHRSNSVLLKPHEQANIKNGSFKLQKNIDVKDVLAWKEGYFVFDNEEIHSVMRKLSRWYNVKVEYEDPQVNEEFVGTISKFKNISEILKLLQATRTIKFKVLPSQDPTYERRVVVMK
ncbi:FecR protein [Pedobacter insulae]|uniref:FecR protein n=1 Tax=Pedobacter insulae TaxID=414048 RepID=A0A1I2T6W1_9SPHI|nr:FecR protein [Pedobacter insulae]